MREYAGLVLLWLASLVAALLVPLIDIATMLIDPTCEVDSIEPVEDELGQTVGYEFHLTCGHSVTKPYIDVPAYCDVCGARVVDDGD